MPTLKEVRQQIDALPDKYIFNTRKEIRYLPKILAPNERILALTSGYMEGRTWLLVCTNHRVLFLDRGMFYGLRQVQMNLDRIQAIDSTTKLAFGSIRMWDGASSVNVNMILKSLVPPFVRAVQQAMDRYKREVVHELVNVASGGMPEHRHETLPAPWLSELERLSKLKESGHLSDAEYAAAKAKLLKN